MRQRGHEKRDRKVPTLPKQIGKRRGRKRKELRTKADGWTEGYQTNLRGTAMGGQSDMSAGRAKSVHPM